MLFGSPEEAIDSASADNPGPNARAAVAAMLGSVGGVSTMGDPFKDDASVADDPKELSLDVTMDSPRADNDIDAFGSSVEALTFATEWET